MSETDKSLRNEARIRIIAGLAGNPGIIHRDLMDEHFRLLNKGDSDQAQTNIKARASAIMLITEHIVERMKFE